MNTIAFVASSSGGHILPCLALAERYKHQNPNTQFLFFTGKSALDMRCIDHHVIDHTIPLTAPVRSTHIFGICKAVIRLITATAMSFYYLLRFRPHKVISTGGLLALPVCTAAFCLRIPYELYELNATPGKAIAWLARGAQTVHVCFKKTQKAFAHTSCKVSAYPLRSALTNQEPISAAQARAFFGLDPERRTVAILGGSQGSTFLNNLMHTYQPSANIPLQFIHQTGPEQERWKQWYATNNISAYVCSFEPNIRYIYSAADVLICRAGSGLLHEILFCGKQCVIIPLPVHLTDHQLANARLCVEQYPATMHMITQEEAQQDPSRVWNTVMSLLQATS